MSKQQGLKGSLCIVTSGSLPGSGFPADAASRDQGFELTYAQGRHAQGRPRCIHG